MARWPAADKIPVLTDSHSYNNILLATRSFYQTLMEYYLMGIILAGASW
jgi:hypothetical protein